MQDFSIRITRREGDVEQSVDIDLGAPIQFVSAPSAMPAPVAKEPTSPLEWSSTLCDGGRVNYAIAEQACAALGDGWRLPTRSELESILDLSRHSPACDPERFPDTKSGYYWTSTTYAANPACAWIVDFSIGDVNDVRRVNGSAFVRAVRSPRQ